MENSFPIFFNTQKDFLAKVTDFDTNLEFTHQETVKQNPIASAIVENRTGLQPADIFPRK